MSLRTIAALVVTLALTPAGHAADIVVAQILDESANALEQSRDYAAGARVYLDWINLQGGVGGRRVSLLVKDDGGDPARARDALRDAIDGSNAVVAFGSVGDAAVVGLVRDGELRKRGIALLAPLSGVETGDDDVYFLRPSHADEALFGIEWFRKSSLTRVALAVDAAPGFTVQRDAILAGLAARGIKAVVEASIGTDGSDAAAAARRIAGAGPQFVLVVADSVGAAQFVRAWRGVDAGTPVVAMSWVRQQTILELAGARSAHGTMLTQVVPDPFKGVSPVARQHVELMRRFRDEPPSHLTFEGFIAAKYLVSVLKSIAGPIDRASVLAALRARRTADLGGIVIAWPNRGNRGSRFVDVTLLRRDGTLLQ